MNGLQASTLPSKPWVGGEGRLRRRIRGTFRFARLCQQILSKNTHVFLLLQAAVAEHAEAAQREMSAQLGQAMELIQAQARCVVWETYGMNQSEKTLFSPLCLAPYCFAILYTQTDTCGPT